MSSARPKQAAGKVAESYICSKEKIKKNVAGSLRLILLPSDPTACLY